MCFFDTFLTFDFLEVGMVVLADMTGPDASFSSAFVLEGLGCLVL